MASGSSRRDSTHRSKACRGPWTSRRCAASPVHAILLLEIEAGEIRLQLVEL
jgi:hypothetical protein